MRHLPLGNQINDILLIAMIIGWFVSKASKDKGIFDKSPFNLILILYVFYTYFTLWSASFFLGFPAPVHIFDPRVQSWKNYMILPILFLLTLNNTKNVKEMKRLFLVMCLVNLIMNYTTIREARWLTAWQNRFKIHGLLCGLESMNFPLLSAYTFVIAGIFLLTKEKMKKIFLGILAWMNAYCILFLFSRGAYLSTLVGAFL